MYNRALEYPEADSACYRSLALTQARTGDTAGAEATMSELQSYGADDADTDLVSAEICAASGDYSEAIRLYRQVLSETDDWEILRHCYISAADLYEEQGDLDSALRLLEEAVTVLDRSTGIQVREMLAEICIAAADQDESRARELNQRAKELFAGIIEDGYGTVVTSMNLASAQQQLGEYDEAEAELLGALEDYPYDYRVDMRLAFLYADWQSVRDIEDRDYSEVEYYYDQATAKYQQAQANGTQDADMQILGNLISQLRSSGWL